MSERRKASITWTVVQGLAGLAAAMGIGRFAFTPMLPLMLGGEQITLDQGSYLASANYLGYLVGAVLCLSVNPPPLKAARYGVAAVAAATLAMAVSSFFPLWLIARFVAGVASAFVLVGVSASAVKALAARGRPDLAGWVFAGVGAGIVVAGTVGLVLGAFDLAPGVGWVILGVVALPVTLLFPSSSVQRAPLSVISSMQPTRFSPAEWRLILSYGIFGFAYIIPATYLPAVARSIVGDPAIFGLAWPVFGLAAALSTVAGSALGKWISPRRSWALGNMVMAIGVALPALALNLPVIVLSAVCVGGTFMLITMNGMQEAQRLAGPRAPRLMAAMTTAFAAFQLVGPLMITGSSSAAEAIRVPSLFAAALLLLGAIVLLTGGRAPVPLSESRK